MILFKAFVVCLLWVMSVEVEVSYDLETEDNLQVNTIVMAGNDCCLSSMCCCPRYNHPSGYLLFLIIWHNSCFTGTRKHNNPYQRSVFSLKRHPPHLLQTRYWLSVYSWWWTAWLSIQERACPGLHILTAHIFQPLLPRQRHTHTYTKAWY